MSLAEWSADHCPAASPIFDNDPRSYYDEQNEEWLDLYRGLLSDDGDFDAKMIWDYARSQMLTWIIPAIFGAMVLIAWLPLWLSRCCAHRCCAPSTPHFSRRFKTCGVGCFSCWSVLLLAFAAVGIIAVHSIHAGSEQLVCATDTVLVTASEWTATTSTTFAASHADIAVAVATLDGVDTQLACLADAHDDARNPCVQYGATVQPKVDALAASLREAGGCNAECQDLETKSADARDQLCAAFSADGLGEIRSAQSGCDETRDLCEQFNVLIDTWGDIMDEQQDAVDSLRDGFGEYVQWYEDTGYSNYAEWVGVAFFAGTIVAVLLAVIAALCMHRTSNKRKVCCNGIGVQVSGGAWVFHSLASPYYFFAGAVGLLALVMYYDHMHVMERTPHAFEEIYTSTRVCDMEVTTVENAAGTGEQYTYTPCAVFSHVLDGCFAETPQPWTDLTLAAFGANYSMVHFRELLKPDDGQVDTAARLEGVDDYNVTAGGRSLDAFEEHVCSLTPASLGLLPSDPAVGAIEGSISEVCDAGTDVVRLTQAPLGCYNELLVMTEALVDASARVTDSTLPNLEAVSCGWIKTSYEALVESVYVLGGPWLVLLVCLICCGAASVFALATIIWLQLIFGDVGRRAGCPAACRCCCPAPRPVRVSRGSSSNFLGTKTEPAVKAPNEVSGNLISV